MNNSIEKRGGFFAADYISALKQHYPELVEGEAQFTIDEKLHIGFVDAWTRAFDKLGVDALDRFQPLSERLWNSERSAWMTSGGLSDPRKVGAGQTYKGLINGKPAVDLVLYSNLIWELQPKTIIEFGSLQGGSALWYADQLDSLCNHGEVHSFELLYKCIHPRACHPRLHFHEADLRDLDSLDEALFRQLPHPWIVIDDAHENLENLIPFVAGFMAHGDYYVIEDEWLNATAEVISDAVKMCQTLGFMVDTKYTDAFGINVTCSLNGWLVKRPSAAFRSIAQLLGDENWQAP